jgi:hypothetical protein
MQSPFLTTAVAKTGPASYDLRAVLPEERQTAFVGDINRLNALGWDGYR